MRFEGTFIDEHGKRINWWFKASNKEALDAHLADKGWKIVSLRSIDVSEERIEQIRHTCTKLRRTFNLHWQSLVVVLIVVFIISLLPKSLPSAVSQGLIISLFLGLLIALGCKFVTLFQIFPVAKAMNKEAMVWVIGALFIPLGALIMPYIILDEADRLLAAASD